MMRENFDSAGRMNGTLRLVRYMLETYLGKDAFINSEMYARTPLARYARDMHLGMINTHGDNSLRIRLADGTRTEQFLGFGRVVYASVHPIEANLERQLLETEALKKQGAEDWRYVVTLAMLARGDAPYVMPAHKAQSEEFGDPGEWIVLPSPLGIFPGWNGERVPLLSDWRPRAEDLATE